MKRTLLLLALGLSLSCPAWAQTDTPPPDASPGGHHPGGMLTPDERTELKTAHDAAFKANPDLETEGKQLHEQMEAFQKKMHDAMVAADPNVEPILKKMEAGHHHGPPPGGGDGGNQ
jgi:Spy/CpxP family protein refolding chaperone